ncbi:GTPase/DUF3482 domain-containing protein [Alteromonas sp. 5E99-2]|uniref:GTPase/DUF3482 domain-containing protein n=1 Tax=Alteromonas sp. 5E99-2 TaxID=2817683 RepID=UPI001A98A838|nr:GTPase/DUF3482 domain-containing protein [Alteromonas sp. 5E99-2]MBO1256117.1 GTPase/DUF3482 domain-containing protein [Alteromonas sp. 5E99-2]
MDSIYQRTPKLVAVSTPKLAEELKYYMKTNTHPQFAVVGHPNKGKSSIVSTLSHDQSIAISNRSGTTEHATTYTVETHSGYYELIDTPGFQRPTRVLKWLNEHCQNASERAKTLYEFISSPQCQEEFRDEVELLTPIVNGAAILYVVDGSRPYGVEYESEMEILRWTGQPSMALINPIENGQFVDEWSSALAQYFKSVRLFNPFNADFDKQIELLKTFVYLNPQWADSLNRITDGLVNKRHSQKSESITILAHLLEDLCAHQTHQKAVTKTQATKLKPVVMKNYTQWMKTREHNAIEELLALYCHSKTAFSLKDLDLPPDLFDCEEWYAWGLNKKQLVSASTIAGAASGAMLDAAIAGSSLMMGTIGGGLIGATGAWIGANSLLNARIKGLPLGGFQAKIGPITNRNFPFVVIGRFLHLYQQIINLNHADRRMLTQSTFDFQKQLELLDTDARKAIFNGCNRLVKQKSVNNLDELLLPLFNLK